MEINIVKYLSIKRIVNIILVITSYLLSIIAKRVFIWGNPITFSIEPTNRCNLQCPECPSGTGTLTRQLGLLSFENFKLLLDQIKDTCFYIQLFFQGEPFINKNIFRMIEYARLNRIYTSISTNGLLLDSNRIEEIIKTPPDKLIFSIDGLDQTTYQNYRVGGILEKAQNSLIMLIELKKINNKKLPFIELQFIAMKQNEHQIDDVFAFGKSVGVDKVVIKTMQVNSYESAVNFLPTNNKYSRYNFSDGVLKIKNKLKNRCFAIWRTGVITWNGDVAACCFDKDAKYNFGNIFKQEFSTIWKSKKFNNFRQAVLNNRKGIDICTNCTEGLKINIFED